MTARLSDWRDRLHTELAAGAGRPWAYGVHDCCLGASDLVLAMTGIDPAASLRGYTGEEGAAAVILANGGTIRAMVDRLLGAAVAPNWAREGDMVLVDGEPEEGIGICLGQSVVVACRPAGWAYRRLERIQATWPIG